MRAFGFTLWAIGQVVLYEKVTDELTVWTTPYGWAFLAGGLTSVGVVFMWAPWRRVDGLAKTQQREDAC